MIVTSPITLEDEVVLLPGGMRTFRAERLQHPFKAHMLIREIRIALTWSADAAADAAVLTNLGGSVKIKLGLGRQGITHNAHGNAEGFVPAWLFGKRITDLLEQRSNSDGGLLTRFHANRFTWTLPRPLFVPGGNMILASAAREAVDALQIEDPAVEVRARLTYSGISLPVGYEEPEKVALPYVTSMIDDSGRADGFNAEEDLENIFEEVLKVQRFIGRVRIISEVEGDPTFEGDFLGLTPLLALQTTDDRHGVNDEPMPFNDVFDVLGRDLPVRCPLRKGEQFLTQLSQKTAGFVTGDAPIMTPMISMIGHRDFPTAKL